MRAGRLAAVAATALGLLLGTATAASADVRYVSPTGGGTMPCTMADNPCPLPIGMASALAASDVVVLAPGEYSVGSVLTTLAGTIAGAPDQPRPHLTLADGVPLPMPATALRHVDITAATPLNLPTGTFEDAVLTSTSNPALTIGAGLVRNAVVRALGDNATAVKVDAIPPVPATAQLRNVTIVASGQGSTALQAVGHGMPIGVFPPFTCIPFGIGTADLRNVIARGTARDLAATGDASCPAITGVIAATSSNFRPDFSTSYTNGGGNQSAVPQFVNEAAGDFREAAGSPTIDAGTIPANRLDLGEFDLGGVLRILDGLPDIGAFEFVVPITLPGGNGGDGGGNPGGGNPGGGNPGGGSGPESKPLSVKLLKPMGLHLGALLKRGWKLHASCSAACTLALKVTPGTGKQRVLARAAGSRKSAGTLMLRVKITKAGRRALKQKRASWLRFTLAGRDATGVRRTAKRVLKVRH